MAWGFSKKIKDVVDDQSAYQYEDEPVQTDVPQPSIPSPEPPRQQQAGPTNPSVRREVENSVISKTCVVKGNIDIEAEDLVVLGCVEGNVNGKGDITLSGVITGDVSCRNFTLVCGELKGTLSCDGNAAIYAEGYMRGDIQRAENVELSGTLEGDIYVHGLTSLLGSAHLSGNVATTRLKIEDGALLNGQVKVLTEVMEEDEPEEEEPEAPAPAPVVREPELRASAADAVAQTVESSLLSEKD